MARTWGLGLEKLTNANLRNFAEMMLCDTSRLGKKTKKEELLKLVYGKLSDVFIEEEEPESAEGGGGTVAVTEENLPGKTLEFQMEGWEFKYLRVVDSNPETLHNLVRYFKFCLFGTVWGHTAHATDPRTGIRL